MKTLRPLRPWMTVVLAVAALLTFLTSALAAGTLPAPGAYVVDAAGSTVGFSATHFVIASVDGKFSAFNGRVTVGDSLATTHIEASVDVQSIGTGNETRDEHLRSADYFDAARFPRMTFVSTMVWGTPDNFGIKGNLTIRGITKEVTFTARIEGTGIVLAQTKIDRADFGMTADSIVKNEVRLELRIKLAKAP